MCAQFLYGSAVLAGSRFSSTAKSSADRQPDGKNKRPRKTLSHGRLLDTLASIVRKPASVLDNIVEDFHSFTFSQGLQEEKEVEDRKSLLLLKLKTATTLEEYRGAALELDKLEGNDTWRDEIESSEYNYRLVQSRLLQLEDARIAGDVERMLFLLRTSLTRNLGGMGNLKLYKHSRIGTKRLIERYISSALATLRALLETSLAHESLYDPRHLLEQILATRQAFGRSALLLSGGGTFGMNHIGVVKSLWEAQLLPRIVSGSSAGSIVCSVLCTRTDAELPQVLDDFCDGDLAVFTGHDEDDGVLQQVARFLKIGAIFDIANLTRVMKNLLGDMTFQEAYNRTRRILNICVSSAGLFELPRLLNYVTAPNIIIWSAVAASCSVPLVFNPGPLLAKNPKTGYASPWNQSPQRWIDGSVDNDIPMTRLAEMFNVNHFIVSQVNPHVVPFLVKEEEGSIASDPLPSGSMTPSDSGLFQKLATLAKDEAMHRLDIFAEMGVFPTLLTKARSVLSQRYSGHITILPNISYTQFPRILQNPTPEFMRQAMQHGQRATWPKLDRIQNHVALELALDDAVQQLRTRIAFSPSQVDLRLNTMIRDSPRIHRKGVVNSRVKRPLSSRESGNRVRRSSTASQPVESNTGSRLIQSLTSIDSTTPKTMLPAPRSAGVSRVRNFDLKSPSEFYTSSDSEDEIEISDDEEMRSVTSDSSEQPALDESEVTLDGTNSPELIDRLFPYASQPASPALYRHNNSSSYFGRGPPSPRIPSLTPANFTMTPLPSNTTIQQQASKESNDSSAKINSSFLDVPGSSHPTSMSLHSIGSELDVSGTRGMILRKKRSLSFSKV